MGTPAQDGRRALVLGGGGSTGNAWVIGVLAGLLDAGLDVTRADLVVGTSAGSTAAAQVTGAPLPELLAAVLQADVPRGAGPAGSVGAAAELMERTARIIAASTGPADMRRRMGEAALESDPASDAARHARWRATVAARLPSPDWPGRRVLLTAVDARTGAPVVFDRDSGVDLVDAVAASTSNGFAHAIGEHRYINGGYRRGSENADLAAGHGRVLVLTPFSGRSRYPEEWGMHLAAQVDELRTGGSSVAVIAPDGDAEHLFGANAMDLSLRPAAARAGHAQGRARAAELAGFWL